MHISNICGAKWRRTNALPLNQADNGRAHGFPGILTQPELRNLVAAMVD